VEVRRARSRIDKREAQRLVGETIRDIGILMVVFAPLDALFQEPRSSAVVSLVVALGLCLIGSGIILGIMDDASMNYLLRWAPTVVAALILVVAGLLLQASNRRDAKRDRERSPCMPGETP